MYVNEAAESVQNSLRRVAALLKEGDVDAASADIFRICRTNPRSVDAHILASQVFQRCNRFDSMLASVEQACAIDGNDLNTKFRLFECRLYCGLPNLVHDELKRLEPDAKEDTHLLRRIAEFYTHCADHSSALRCYRRAAELKPDDPEILFAVAASEIANGDFVEADNLLNRVIELNPRDFDAYRNRATLKKQTVEENHIAEILDVLQEGPCTPAGEVQLCYALAKEHEDLNKHQESFQWLQRGASKRRSLLSYRVEGDVRVMERLRSVFDKHQLNSKAPGFPEKGPVFVLGLPRSGTTLVDRILCSHSQVSSLGEVNNFAYSLMHTIGQAGDKLELIEHAANTDFFELGKRYLESVRRYQSPTPFLIDKTPLNYLYIGLIHLALPNARVVHVTRNPMDSCYGMYRALFRAGYPFSYDFSDLAKYYLAYRQLMDHWRDVVPGSFIDVGYEDLVNRQEKVSREIVEYCGLDWEPGCLEFHKNPAAVATASSAQVRRPVYRDAIHRWRRYERQLQPLADMLRDGGIDISASQVGAGCSH